MAMSVCGRIISLCFLIQIPAVLSLRQRVDIAAVLEEELRLAEAQGGAFPSSSNASDDAGNYSSVMQLNGVVNDVNSSLSAGTTHTLQDGTGYLGGGSAAASVVDGSRKQQQQQDARERKKAADALTSSGGQHSSAISDDATGSASSPISRSSQEDVDAVLLLKRAKRDAMKKMMAALTKESDALDAEITALLTDSFVSTASESNKMGAKSRSRDMLTNVSKPASVEEKSNATQKRRKYGPSTGVNHTKEQSSTNQTHDTARRNTIAKPERPNVSNVLPPVDEQRYWDQVVFGLGAHSVIWAVILIPLMVLGACVARCCWSCDWSRADAKDATAGPGVHRIFGIYSIRKYDTEEALSSSSDSDGDLPHPLSERIERRRAKRSKANRSGGPQLQPVGMHAQPRHQGNDADADPAALHATQGGPLPRKSEPSSLSGSGSEAAPQAPA